ncbi:MAG: V-type ATP synthase subunit D [Bacteroidales bacterium]|nr:V-type ATP synthase subunit D [Lentimicrobiaceae bacterium]MDD5696012.1 V-type ATP synthase subunit D [Bacteroidales bacterium]
MAIKFQFNKTALQELNKQLTVRERALPTIKNKETALRVEVKKARDTAQQLEMSLKVKMAEYDKAVELWGEFDPSLLSIRDVQLSVKKIAGVKTPVLEKIDFETGQFSLFNQPSWILDGIQILRELASVAIEREVYLRKMQLLDFARRKTTQKVNLYEKVQIPGYQDAIRKIKRFMEDEENLSKSAQKILKSRQDSSGEAV